MKTDGRRTELSKGCHGDAPVKRVVMVTQSSVSQWLPYAFIFVCY